MKTFNTKQNMQYLHVKQCLFISHCLRPALSSSVFARLMGCISYGVKYEFWFALSDPRPGERSTCKARRPFHLHSRRIQDWLGRGRNRHCFWEQIHQEDVLRRRSREQDLPGKHHSYSNTPQGDNVVIFIWGHFYLILPKLFARW